MTLQQFLNQYGIQTSSLEAIKKRVFIVGRFNTADQETSSYLFSKSRRRDPRYKDSKDLSYASFIDVIRPTLTEYYKQEEIASNEFLPYFELSPQKMDIENGDASYVIDPYNYFFSRATSSSEHPYFKENIINNLPANLLVDTPGETIYKQIRARLNTFCAFQYRNFDIIRCFARLLANNKGKGGIPPNYSDGEELPAKFIPLFIDFLYKEGVEPFTTDLVDFESHQVWQTVISGNKKELFVTNFQKIVTAFKNYLIDPKGLNKERIDGITLDSLPQIVDENLRLQFVTSRESYNILQQIIKSKVLLSMVLQWAISYFHTLQSVKEEIGDVNINTAIENAINDGTDGLPKPDKVSDKPVGELIQEFKTFFPVILDYVYYSDGNEESAGAEVPKYKEDFLKLPEFLQKIGNSILSDPLKAQNIKMVLNMEPEQKKATLKAIENHFTDVLIPKMYKEPGMDLKELKKRFESYERELFQTSSMLEVSDNKNVEAIFDVDADGQKNGSGEDRLVFAINKMVEFLVHKDVLEGIQRTAQTIRNFSTLRQLSSPTAGAIGAGGIGGFLAPVDDKASNAYGNNIVNAEQKVAMNGLELGTDRTHNNIQKLLEQLHTEERVEQHLLGKGSDDGKKELVKASDNGSTVATIATDGAGHVNGASHSNGVAGNSLIHALEKYVGSENKALAVTEVAEIIKKDVKSYHLNLSKIYKRYAEPNQLPAFKNKVEAMTLAQLLLLHQNDLRLDKPGTNLYDLLLDMVDKIDQPDQPDIAKFFSEHSLTKYISAKHFKHGGKGFGALETILKNQAEDSLKNVVQYVSELHGVKYLFDTLNKNSEDSEVIVVNASSDEFLEWIKKNINANNGRDNLFNPAGLANNNSKNPQFPIVAFMTELAFNKYGWNGTFSEKLNFLRGLKSFGDTTMENGSNIALLPPICIATSVVDADNKWVDQGKELNLLSNDTYSPVLILGPSIPLNNSEDKLFNTILSAGYIYCTHLLTNGQDQRLDFSGINANPFERFRNIGYGTFGVAATIKSLIEGSNRSRGETSYYSYAADFYLYIIGLIVSAAEYSSEGLSNQEWDMIYKSFYFDEASQHQLSKILDQTSLFKKMPDWSLSNDISSGEELKNVILFSNNRKDLKDATEFGNVTWFNNLVNILQLHK